MEIQIQGEEKPRRALWAGVLSVAATGLGHIYCGKIEKGLVLFFISFVFAPIIASVITTGSSGISLFAVICSVFLLVFVFFYAIIDAIIIARRMTPSYFLKEYNRWYIYLTFIVVSITYPTTLANTIRDHIMQAYKIAGENMTPSILKKDYVLINKAVYRKKSPEIGDIVVFVNPNQRHLDYIKRIVAMPGDTIEMIDNVVYINDTPLMYKAANPKDIKRIEKQISGEVLIEVNRTSQYKIMLSTGTENAIDLEKTTIPNGHCFVLGDNRNNSVDSRLFGPVPLSDVKGRVDYIYLPSESWTRFGKYRD
ncbi:MAG: signal peptidase I [Proteobacteria bacterium]|nr:signal peptidase I [Pseudomonadota bacterium]